MTKDQQRTFTHRVHFVRVYLDSRREPTQGFVNCTGEKQARQFANEAANFDPPVCANAHRFEDVRLEILRARP